MSEESGWLDALEERVHQAAERIGALGEENVRLRTRVAELERELKAARAGAPAAGKGETAAWRQERAEVRRRVEKLAERLGELFTSAGE